MQGGLARALFLLEGRGQLMINQSALSDFVMQRLADLSVLRSASRRTPAPNR
jgi:hypothetical protein